MKRIISIAIVAVVLGGFAPAVSASGKTPPPKKYKNCTELRKVYPMGVARNAKAAGSTGAKVDAKTYKLNNGLDLYKEGIACPPMTATISRETARAWPEKFCGLTINMTRTEVRAIMGRPTASFEQSSWNQDQYSAWGYDLTIFYDINNLAEQMQSTYDNVPCGPKFR
jgi:hypothetical protein